MWGALGNFGREGPVSIQWCLYLTPLVFFFFLLGLASQFSPPVSLSPLKAAGPWPLQRRPSKPSSFQPRRRREPPLFPPTGNIPFSRGDNFIHLVRHCIQLNAESYGDTRVNWASVRACVERRGGVTSSFSPFWQKTNARFGFSRNCNPDFLFSRV